MEQNYTRYFPNASIGLNDEQVKNRFNDNLVNYDTCVPTKSIKRILIENFFTLFNFLNLFLAVCVFLVGSYKNMLFLLIVIINTLISTIQEIHSKMVVDKLSILSTSKVNVIRNGSVSKISINEIVLDDVIKFSAGNQVPIDCSVLDGFVEVDESFITGEPNTIIKNVNDMILSGSIIISGKCVAKVEHIGNDNYTSQISSGAKYVKKIKSEIISSLNKIIKILTFTIIPLGLLLFINQLNVDNSTFQSAVVKSVAAVIGMIPEGLVLLTSTVLAISVIRLSKSKVLVQELYCIETLARVDVLCLDKTGTLTENKMIVNDYIPWDISRAYMYQILGNFALNSVDENSTIIAIRNYFSKNIDKWNSNFVVPFSSKSKWSGVQFDEHGSYVIGAPEFVLRDSFPDYKNKIENYSNDYRVLIVAYSNMPFKNNELPENLTPLGLILISDKIKNTAKQTLSYFKKQGVDLKIISGDNPITVSRIAKQVGIDNYCDYIDMSTLDSNSNLEEIVCKYSIFGRVSPTQKRDLVIALQNINKTVAMVGDGVNDVLALKSANCSIGMANGSDAAKNVSQLVLLDSDFSSMPKVVEEGRRAINNIERSASLFLVKTLFSTILAFIFLFIDEIYPFSPIQLSLISIITIGIPSFVLALEPNIEKVRQNFLRNVIFKALPTAISDIINVFAITILYKFDIIPLEYYSSLCIFSTSICGILLLFTLSKSRESEISKFPISIFRFLLAFFMCLLFFIGFTVLGNWFNICVITGNVIYWLIRITIICLFNFSTLNILFTYISGKK